MDLRSFHHLESIVGVEKRVACIDFSISKKSDICSLNNDLRLVPVSLADGVSQIYLADEVDVFANNSDKLVVENVSNRSVVILWPWVDSNPFCLRKVNRRRCREVGRVCNVQMASIH